jgi:hypothetical protein
MKIQAESSRPAATVRDSQNMTVLMNWVIGTQMQIEAFRETRLARNWTNANGAAVLAVDWEQERRIDYIQVSLMTLSSLTEAQGMSGQQGLLGELQGTDLMQWQSIIADESNETALVPFIQRFSPIVNVSQARKIIRDLRELRFAEVPIPYIFKSKPRWRAMRPMRDVFFDKNADDLNISPRWVGEPEYLTETELTDRVETANYDPGFVKKAIDRKGNTGSWVSRQYEETDDKDELIEIWRFKYRVLDRGTPVLMETIFHMDVEMEALHGPCQYDHGNFGYHPMRFEYHDRPILSSRGIAEIAYTWQNEIKAQRDGRTDRVALSLKPVMFADYKDVLRLQQSYMPGAVLGERRGDSFRKDPPPQYDPGSTEIEATTIRAINEHFGLFGNEVDPALKQQRQQERADNVLIEMKPVVAQTGQLCQQLLPDAQVAAVTGGLGRPFHLNRDQIQGQYEMKLTVDMRNLDPSFLEQKLGYMERMAALDTTGQIDRNKYVRLGLESIDVTIADETIQNTEVASEKEISDERTAISIIIGSGVDQPLPKAGNFQLRLQTDQTMLQELQSNPAAMKNIQNNPETMKVIQNRMTYFQRQIQQTENAKIGRTQVSKTFTNQAPQMEQPALGMGGGYGQ